MSYQLICDLCKKPLRSGGRAFKFKIKEEWCSWDDHGWNYIDVHEDCLKKLLNGTKENNDE